MNTSGLDDEILDFELMLQLNETLGNHEKGWVMSTFCEREVNRCGLDSRLLHWYPPEWYPIIFLVSRNSLLYSPLPSHIALGWPMWTKGYLGSDIHDFQESIIKDKSTCRSLALCETAPMPMGCLAAQLRRLSNKEVKLPANSTATLWHLYEGAIL